MNGVPDQYYVEFSRIFSAAHRIPLHLGHCNRIHGHNYKVEVIITSDELDDTGFVVDWGIIKKEIDAFDHVLILEDSDPLIALLNTAGPHLDAIFDGIKKVRSAPTTEFLAQELAEIISREALYYNTNATQVSAHVTLHETDHISARASDTSLRG